MVLISAWPAMSLSSPLSTPTANLGEEVMSDLSQLQLNEDNFTRPSPVRQSV